MYLQTVLERERKELKIKVSSVTFLSPPFVIEV